MEGRPWSECQRGNRLFPRGLASLLKPFKVNPKNIKLPGQRVLKGYYRTHLQPVWDAYLPKGGSVSATAATAQKQKDLGDSLSATKPMVVADTKTCNPLKISDVAAVADRKPLSPDQYEELEERAAIMEYDGGLTREEAERAAWESVGPRPAQQRSLRETRTMVSDLPNKTQSGLRRGFPHRGFRGRSAIERMEERMRHLEANHVVVLNPARSNSRTISWLCPSRPKPAVISGCTPSTGGTGTRTEKSRSALRWWRW